MLECKECGKTIKMSWRLSASTSYNGYEFCSKKCSRHYMREHKKEYQHRCRHCNKKYYTDDKFSRLCSDTCRVNEGKQHSGCSSIYATV